MNPNAAMAVHNDMSISNDSGVTESCLHCGRPAVYRSSFHSKIVAFCCAGCEGVYRFLQNHHFETYYDILSRVDSHAPTQSLSDGGKPASDESCANIDSERFRSLNSSHEYAIFFPGFTCAACLWLVDKVIRDVPGVCSFRIQLEEQLLVIRIDAVDATPILRDVLGRMAAVGYYGFSPSQDRAGSPLRQKSQRALIQLGIAGAVFANVMLFASSVYFMEFFEDKSSFEWFFNCLSLGLTTLSLATAGRSFFKNVYRSMRVRVLHIDVPIVFALTVAWSVSVLHMLQGVPGVYFDSISGLVFFLLLGRYLNDILIAKAQAAVGIATQQINHLSPEIKLGAHVTVDHGMVVPADGRIISGIAEVREAFLTGESNLDTKCVGDFVYGGTLNFGSPFRMEVTAIGSDTRLAHVTNLVKQVQEKPSRMEQQTAWIARCFSWVTLVLALGAGFFWLRSGFATSLEVVCSVLIVSCPCALAMGIPLANALAAKRLWHKGIVLQKGDALDRATTIDTIVFDKTGTLTMGEMEVIDATGTDAELTAVLGAVHTLTRGFVHPVAKAVHKWAEVYPSLQVLDVKNKTHPGRGMEFTGHWSVHASQQEFQIYIGSLDWVSAHTESQSIRSIFEDARGNLAGDTKCGIVIRRRVLSSFREDAVVLTMKDQVRTEAKDLISIARRRGIKIRLLSGDRGSSAVELGLSLGFKWDEIFGEKLPTDKLSLIDSWSSGGERILMVGDGVNDASAVKHATLGVAVSGGVDLTKHVADVLLVHRDLSGILQIIDYAKYHLRTLRVILAISLFYNAVAIGLALSNHIHPLTAALIMPLSSLTVVIGIWARKGESIWKSSISSCRLP